MDELNRIRLEIALHGPVGGASLAEAHDRFAAALLANLEQRARRHPLLYRVPEDRRADLLQEAYLVARGRMARGGCPIFSHLYLDRLLLDARRKLDRAIWRLRVVPLEAGCHDSLVTEVEESAEVPSPACLQAAFLAARATLSTSRDSRFTRTRGEVADLWISDIIAGHTPRGFPRRHPGIFAPGISQPTRSRAVCDVLRELYAALTEQLPELPGLAPDDSVALRNRLQQILCVVHPRPSTGSSRRVTVPTSLDPAGLVDGDPRLQRVVDLYASGLERTTIARTLAGLPDNASQDRCAAALEALDCELDRLVVRARDVLCAPSPARRGLAKPVQA